MTRKWILLGFLVCAAAPAQEIGANYNHDPEIIDLSLLKRVPVEWIRTTPYIFEYIKGEKRPDSGEGLGNVIRAHQAGYKVAFGFRWDFRKFGLRIPQPGSADEKDYFGVARQILERVGSSIEIFTLGNEPTLETMEPDMQPDSSGAVPLVRFTERLLTEVVQPCYRAHSGWKRPAVYVGSLPALFEPRMQKLPAVAGLIELAQNSPAIEGLSIHLHIETEQDMREAFEFVRHRMPAKPIIVPEFSLHRLFVKHLKDPLGADQAGREFAARFHRDPEMRLHQWYSLANQHKVSTEEWSEMFASCSWFPPHFLLTYYRYFEQYDVRLATYGFVSQYAPPVVPPNGSAWFINPIFPAKSLPPSADGSPTPNPLWIDDFVAIVNKSRAKRNNQAH